MDEMSDVRRWRAGMVIRIDSGGRCQRWARAARCEQRWNHLLENDRCGQALRFAMPRQRVTQLGFIVGKVNGIVGERNRLRQHEQNGQGNPGQ